MHHALLALCITCIMRHASNASCIAGIMHHMYHALHASCSLWIMHYMHQAQSYKSCRYYTCILLSAIYFWNSLRTNRPTLLTTELLWQPAAKKYWKLLKCRKFNLQNSAPACLNFLAFFHLIVFDSRCPSKMNYWPFYWQGISDYIMTWYWRHQNKVNQRFSSTKKLKL